MYLGGPERFISKLNVGLSAAGYSCLVALPRYVDSTPIRFCLNSPLEML